MQYRRLGSSGLQLSALSFGTWVTFGGQVDRSHARELLACAFDHGVNYFDSSETYGAGQAETILGETLVDLKVPRDAYCVSSKVFFGAVTDPKPTQKGLSRKHVTEACQQALKRLRVDYLDCYFCHRPDPDMPVAETVWAMDTLIRQGKVLYWGTSEWPVESIREAHAVATRHHLHAPTMEQPQYNLLHRARVEVDYAPLYRELGMGTMIWSPLASGVLTGKYTQGAPEGSRLALADYHWLRERYDRGRAFACPEAAANRERAGRNARSVRDRLVPQKPECLHRDVGCDQTRAACRKPHCTGCGGQTQRGGDAADRCRIAIAQRIGDCAQQICISPYATSHSSARGALRV